MHQLAVIGNPIEHSLSPLIWGLFARQFGIEINYRKILAKDEQDFEYQVRIFFEANGTALNVTAPFKNAAYAISDIHSQKSSISKASNFLTIQSGKIISDTTDGIGLLNDITLNKNQSVANKNILIIGSGFVLDSILSDFIAQKPISIDILARNEVRTGFLNKKFATGFFDKQKNYDIIINTTPNTANNMLFGQVECVNDNILCYDLGYTNNLFLGVMKNINPNIIICNGIGMLVEQASVAFTKLFNETPDTKVVFEHFSKIGYYV